MRIIYLLVIICLCLVNAKYLPNEGVPRNVLSQARASDDVSDISTDSNNNDYEEGLSNINNGGIREDPSKSTHFNIYEQNWIQQEQEFMRKLEEENRKHEQKMAEEMRKLEEKRVKEERKLQEKLEKEERKRLERIEKARQKHEEIERKRQEKLKKEERKRHQNIINLLESLEEQSSESEESSQTAETNQFLALFDIENTYIIEEYGLSDSNSESKRKIALKRFLNEEVGINENSTKDERRQAIVSFIHNKILKETETPANFKSYVLKHVSGDDIQHIEANLQNQIDNLKNESTLLNDTLPWITEAQKKLQDKTEYLQALHSLSKLISKWLSESQCTSDSVSTSPASTHSGSSTDTANIHSTTIDQSSSSKDPLHGTHETVDHSSSDPNTEIGSSSDNIPVTTKPLNPSEATQSTATNTINSVSTTVSDIIKTTGSNDGTVSESQGSGSTATPTSESSANVDGITNTNEMNSTTVLFDVDATTISVSKPPSTDLSVTESSHVNIVPSQPTTETHNPSINPIDVSSSTIGISTQQPVDTETKASGTEGKVNDVSVTETTITEKLSTNLHIVDELATTISGNDAPHSSTIKPILSTETISLSTDLNQITQESVAATVVTGSPDVSIALDTTTTVNYSDSSSTDTTVSHQPKTTSNPENGTEATKIDTTATVATNVDAATTGSESPVTEVISTTDLSGPKHVPTEINTLETVTVYTERTAPHAVVVPAEPAV